MFGLPKYRARREQAATNHPAQAHIRQAFRTAEVWISLAIVLVFFALATAITTLREHVVRCRPDEYVHQDLLSRVSFSYTNPERVSEIRQAARDAAPRVYRAKTGLFDRLERRLLALPDDVAGNTPLPKEIADHLDSGSITLLKSIRRTNADDYKKWTRDYVAKLREASTQLKLTILPNEEREKELQTPSRLAVKIHKTPDDSESVRADVARTFSDKPTDTKGPELLALLNAIVEQSFLSPLSANIAGFTLTTLGPTHSLDQELTAAEQNQAALAASIDSATRQFPEKAVLVSRDTCVTQSAWKLLVEEHQAYLATLSLSQRIQSSGGMAVIVALISAVLAVYIVLYKPRAVRKHARAAAIAALFLAMLLVAQLAAVGTGPLLLFGTAPTILVAMILAIVYDQRFALGVATLHGILVTATVDQPIGFLLIIFAGIATSCFLLNDVRTRSKLLEVGGATALAMMLAAAALGGLQMDPLPLVGRNCLYTGAAGLAVGFIVLGILPFIEKAFRITTSMTLLELADASQPLLRRLAIEAPGTYSHSLQVATLAEATAEAIDANSLLCRVGACYHDIGKINKADYFCENQIDGQNRHLNLTPDVSLNIILAHVRDGVEIAREYHLPNILFPFIQAHHGTTLVECFYQQACSQRTASSTTQPPVDEKQYRYPGPKPRTREAAIVMIADAVESAARSMLKPDPDRIESLVHDLIMMRLEDRQFDDSELNFQQLQIISSCLARTLLSLYHGRLAYPSTAATTHSPATAEVKSA